jgi:Glycosyl hydrolase family 1
MQRKRVWCAHPPLYTYTTYHTSSYPPQWFEELGGFEVSDNIPIFVGWALRAIELFGSRIKYWATFNEPTARSNNIAPVYPCLTCFCATLLCLYTCQLFLSQSSCPFLPVTVHILNTHTHTHKLIKPHPHIPSTPPGVLSCTICAFLQCAMFLGWITGMHPPGKVLACITAGRVVMHKLQAHVQAYEAIKRTPTGRLLQVC